MRFENQHLMISGGAGDIGAAIAVAFLNEGGCVSLGDVIPKKDALARFEGSDESRLDYREVDVTRESDIANWWHHASERFGTPTHVAPNAAIVEFAPLDTLDAASWRRQLDVNLDGSYLLASLAARNWKSAGVTGCIVFVGSWAAHRANPDITAYCVSKAGLRMLCQCLALEFAPHGIRVNEIAPGYVDAGLSGRGFKADPARRSNAERYVPLQSLISPQEVARNVLWLCDPENPNITGTTLLVDGGLSLIGGNSKHGARNK